jgi:dTDP-4-dehydrorhamnose 3,5-epimerase
MAQIGTWKTTSIPGVLLLHPQPREDARGAFVKCFHAGDFDARGLESQWRESYYTVSRKNVIRGMHFQSPPDDYAKLVTVLSGRVRDVVLDLRRGSPAFGEHLSVELSEAEPALIYLPRGVAHGFGTLSEATTMLYWVTAQHAPERDAGIRWDSFGADWGIAAPLLSERDRALPALADYLSPFTHAEHPA